MPDGQTLSQQDIQDLQDIKSKLPPDHPMRGRIDATISTTNAGDIQTHPGGDVVNVQHPTFPLTDPRDAVAIGKANSPEFQADLATSKKSAAAAAPTMGGLAGGLMGSAVGMPTGGTAIGAGIGRTIAPLAEDKSITGGDVQSGAETGVTTYGIGKAFEWLTPALTRMAGQGRGILKDVASKYISPRLGEAIFPEAPVYEPYGGGSASAPKPSPSGTAGTPEYGKPGVDLQRGRITRQPASFQEPEPPVTPKPVKPYGGGSAKRPGFTPNRGLGEPVTGRPSVGRPVTSRPTPISESVGPKIAPPDEGVQVIPEPNKLFPGENEGYMAGIPRQEELPEMAGRGKPGAGKQLQQLGRKVIYAPRPTIGRR